MLQHAFKLETTGFVDPGRHPPLGPQVQTFFAVNPVGLFVIDQPALAPQQDVDAARAVANARGGDRADSLSLGTIVTRMWR